MRKSKAGEALRVAQDVAAIRTALTKSGYRIRKRPKQAAWTILPPLNKAKTGGETGRCYLLTYQPAPISAWVLHPQNNDTDRQTIETLIQPAITKSAL
jgi:hypothetical protein